MKGLGEVLVLFGEVLKIICLFICFLFALGLRFCAQAFSSSGKQGYSLVAVCAASHCSGFSHFGAWALGTETPEDAAHRP